MTAEEKVELLIEQAAELPDEAQAELLQSLAEMHFRLSDADECGSPSHETE